MKNYLKRKYIKDYIKKNYIWIIIKTLLIALFIFADIATKVHFAKAQGDSEFIPKVISFTFVKNTGAAFGIFPNGSAWLVVFSVLFLLIFTLYDVANKEQNTFSQLGFAFVFAGAIGNMIDRIFLGYVRDFIVFDFMNFPVFNLADVFITIGCILYVIYILIYLFVTKKNKKIKNTSLKIQDNANVEENTENKDVKNNTKTEINTENHDAKDNKEN